MLEKLFVWIYLAAIIAAALAEGPAPKVVPKAPPHYVETAIG